MVTVHVSDGIDAESFPMLRRFICPSSPYLRRVFWHRQQAGQTPELDIHEQPRVFTLYVNWVYLGIIINDGGSEQDLHDINDLFRLWILADKMRTRSLQREVLEMIRLEEGYHGTIRYETMAYVYENTESGCALRKYLVDRATLGDLESVGTLFRNLELRPLQQLPAAMMGEMLMAYNYRVSIAARPHRHRRTCKEISLGAPKFGRRRPDPYVVATERRFREEQQQMWKWVEENVRP